MDDHTRGALERSARGTQLAFSHGRTTLVDDSQGPVMFFQVDQGPKGGDGKSLLTRDRTPRIGEFGFASHPPAGADVVMAHFRGDRSEGVVIGTNHPEHRLGNLAEGDAAIFDSRGAYVWLTPNGLVIEAKGLAVRIQDATTVTIVASQKVRLETPLFECTGDILDNCDAQSATVKALRTAYDGHVHPGVQAGAASTAKTTSTV